MARNFLQEGMNPLKPKVDNRSFSDGVTGSQFPSYELALASIYKVTGEHFWVHRCFSLLLYFMGALGMYYLLLYISNNRLMAVLACWGYLWSPELFYHGINALPDTLALPASIWGFYFAIKWLDNKKAPTLIAAFLLLSLAGMTKIQFLAIGFPLAAYLLLRRKSLENWKQWLSIIAIGVGILGLTYAWYSYAEILSNKSGMHDFVTKPRAAKSMADFWFILQKNLVSDLPETLLNFANFSLFVLGVVGTVLRKKWKSIWFLPLVLWGLGLLVYYFLGMNQMKVHLYYLMPFMPLLLIVAAYGGHYLNTKKAGILLLILMVAQPILCSIRILPSRWMKQDKMVPPALYEKASRERLQKAVPNDELCIVALDPSASIYLYFLNKKGFSMGTETVLTGDTNFGEAYMAYFARKGLRYIYLDKPSLVKHPRVAPYIKETILLEGDFGLYEIGPLGSK